MYIRQLPKNSKKTECHQDMNDHHFTKSFEIDQVCDYDLESLDIRYELKESEKRLTQLINDKNDKLYEIIGMLIKKIDRLTPLSQSQISVKHEEAPKSEVYEFQTLYESEQDNYKVNPSEIQSLSQIKDVQFQQSTSNICIEEEYSLLENPKKILERLQNCFLKMNLKFTQCKMLFDFPDMIGTDFHAKIDNKNDLLFLAELENNEVIGAFTHKCFDSTPNPMPKENKKSFLCNLNRDVFAFASRFNKTLTYDENFFILGNWEIKVKVGENILKTDWGKKSDCFQYTTFGEDKKHTMKQAQFFGQNSGEGGFKMNRYAFYALS